MAQRPAKPAGQGGSRPVAGSSRSRQKGKPVQIQTSRPWGLIVGSIVGAAALVGILVFAIANQGSGAPNALGDLDGSIKGVVVAKPAPARGHVPGPVRYAQNPPNGGDHNEVPQQCAVYASAIAPEHAVHSLEHGAVWITYNPSLPAADVKELAGKVTGNPYRLMSPVPGQAKPIDLSAWGRRLSVDSIKDKRIDKFLDGYTNGPQTPEKGAACLGNTTTGPIAPLKDASGKTLPPTDANKSAPGGAAAQPSTAP